MSIADPFFPATTLISAKNIGVSYGNRIALQPLSFEVISGEIFGLIGANGGGKTTTLRVLSGLLPTSVGQLSLFGQTGREKTIKHQVGYVSQSTSLYQDLTVRENLNFHAGVHGIENHEAAIENVMVLFDLKPFADTRVSSLSGGWTRLAQLSASVLHQPKLLLLDEPTAGLDVAMRSKVWQHIDRVARQGTGVVISTHDLNEALCCTHAVFLADGKSCAQGTPNQIFAQADITVYLIKNNDLYRLDKLIYEIDECIKCSRENDALRVVIRKSATHKFQKFCQRAGAEVKTVELSMDDASFAFLAGDSDSV